MRDNPIHTFFQFLIMFAATQAGHSLGLDNLIAKRLVPVPVAGGFYARAFRSACSAA